MATKKSTIDKKALKADIIRAKNAKTDEDLDKIEAKYADALKEMDESKAAPKKEPAKKPTKPVVASAPTTKKAPAKKEAEKKEPVMTTGEGAAPENKTEE